MSLNTNTLAFNTDDVTVYLAAAGAGKTTALMNEMVELLKVYRPDEIAFVTYTRKGVANGIERALQANPHITREELVHFKTLHALCFRELGLKPDSMVTSHKMKKFNKELGFRVTMRGAFDQQTDDDKLISRYDVLRSGSMRGIYVEDEKFDSERYNILVKAYENFKKRYELADFFDCLSMFKEQNKPVGVKVAFIDEAQDLTLLQWEVCRTAFSDCERIYIAGDDYQTLFSYAGARQDILISLSDKYKVIKLERSYRLPQAVYRFARGISHVIEEKVDKDFHPAKDAEGFIKDVADRNALLRHIKKDLSNNGMLPSRWYLLFRNNCFIENVAALLEQLTIPYHTSKGFVVAERDLMKIKRYYNFRKKGFGSPESFKKFCEEYEIDNIEEDFTESKLINTERKYVYFDYVEKWGVNKLEEMAGKEPSVLLSTIHRVKGGEADYTAVFLDCTKRVDANALINIDEELRTLYVACTRPKVGLYLVASNGAYGLDRIVETVREAAA